jgi:DNA repair protein RadD
MSKSQSLSVQPRPYQFDAANCLNAAIWDDEDSKALFVAPVASGKTVILASVAVNAIARGCNSVVVVSRSKHIADQSLKICNGLAPDIGAGLFTGNKKQDGCQILFATAPALARRLSIVEEADLVLIDEADQAFFRETTKEYSAICAAARKYAGVTGTPFVLENGCTVPIYGEPDEGKPFDVPCGMITKEKLRDLGHFHFIEAAPAAPSKQLKIDRKTKVDPSGDFNTKVQAMSATMLTTIAADTALAMGQLPDQQFLFFGSTTEQCDKQTAAYRDAGLRVACYHNGLSATAQKDVMDRFRAGELQGLCTVAKVNRGFDLPNISLVVIGFGTASRSKYEQMCGRAQRVFQGKTCAWVLDYGRHGERFGSANWDAPVAIEFDRREKLRNPAEELAATIRAGRADPKCEMRPDNFLDVTEVTTDLFEIVAKPSRSGNGVNLYFIHGLAARLTEVL